MKARTASRLAWSVASACVGLAIAISLPLLADLGGASILGVEALAWA